MNRPRLRRRPADTSYSYTKCTPVLSRLAIFVVAFWIGTHSASRTTNNDNTLSNDAADNGWNSIHVFYGNTTTMSSNNNQDGSNEKWHSQAGQDELVATLLDYKRGGFFIDLAANDAIQISNTYRLEQELDWTGVCIEPTPGYWNDLITLRKCHAVGAVVGNASSTLVPWRRRKEYSGIVGETFDNAGAVGRVFPTKYTVSLESVFEKMRVPQTVDYLSLDVEGAEEYIMSDFLSSQRGRHSVFSIMTIERPSKSLMTLLEKRGYVFLATLSDWGETIWAHESVTLNKNVTLLEHYRAKYASWNPDTKPNQ